MRRVCPGATSVGREAGDVSDLRSVISVDDRVGLGCNFSIEINRSLAPWREVDFGLWVGVLKTVLRRLRGIDSKGVLCQVRRMPA